MDTAELLKKVRLIEIKTRGLSNQIFSGEYHAAFKGRGMAFSEVRQYTPGDEIRTIDWNVTARFNEPYVKVFEEEREITVQLLVDVSGSEAFGSSKQLKREVLTEICAVLAFSAIKNNDKVGVLFFSDKVEKYIPPKKGKSHILRIIRELIEFKPENKGTDIGKALGYFSNITKKRSICFVLSDFMDPNFEDALKIANRKHDVVALQVSDKSERQIPKLGLVRFRDAETGQQRWVNTNDSRVRKKFEANARKHDEFVKDIFRRAGVDAAHINTEDGYIKPLKSLFNRR